MNRQLGTLAAVVLVAAAIGCKGQGTGTARPAGTNPSAKEAAASREVVFTFHRSGGMSGVMETMTVTAGGQVTIAGDEAEPRQFALDRPTLARLQQAFRQSKFATYGCFDPPRPVLDGFSYAITHQGHTVAFADGSPPLPEDLSTIVRAISGIMRAVSSRPAAGASAGPKEMK